MCSHMCRSRWHLEVCSSRLQAGVQGGAGDLQFASADAAACSAFAGTSAGGANTAGLESFAVTVQQPSTSPWLMRFPPQPTGLGSAAAPIDVEAACGLRGYGKPRWVRPDGSLSEACCQEHTRLMAVARRDTRGGGLDSPSLATQAISPSVGDIALARPR